MGLWLSDWMPLGSIPGKKKKEKKSEHKANQAVITGCIAQEDREF